MNTCPNCFNSNSGFITPHDILDPIKCRTCDGSGAITNVHSRLLKRGFQEITNRETYTLGLAQTNINKIEKVTVEVIRIEEKFHIHKISFFSPYAQRLLDETKTVEQLLQLIEK